MLIYVDMVRFLVLDLLIISQLNVYAWYMEAEHMDILEVEILEECFVSQKNFNFQV